MLLVMWSLCLSAVVGGAPAAAQPPLTLVEGGAARAVIVIPSGRDPKTQSPTIQFERHAANALQGHLAQMSGAKLAIVDEAALGAVRIDGGKLVPEPGKTAANAFILVGEGALARQLGVTSDGLEPGGIRIRTTPNALVLIGHPRVSSVRDDGGGLRHAVVAFLEHLGCRYLWPGESGKVIPKTPTVAVSAIDVQFSPPIGQRHIRWQPTGPRYHDKGLAFLGVTVEDWKERRAVALKTESDLSWHGWQGLNGYALGITGGHNGAGLGPAAAEALKQHPEWGALQADGTRDQTNAKERYRLCVSNPQLAEFVADLIIQRANEAPHMISHGLSPQDGGLSSFCMCEPCKKLDPPDAPKIKVLIFEKVGSPQRTQIDYPSLSDRYVHYWNSIAQRVAKVHPNLLLVVDAYSTYTTAPVREKLHPNLVVRYVPGDPSGWEGWKAAGAQKLFWRPNNLHSGYREATVNYNSDARQIADNISAFAAAGMIAIDIQGIYDNWATQGMNYYAAARAIWDPKLTYDEILDDYCRAGFGPAAAPIKQYFVKVEALGRTFEKTTPQAMAELKSQLDAADKAAGQDEALRKRIAFLRAGLDYSAITARIAQMRLAAQNKEPFDKALAARLLDQRWLLMREMYHRDMLPVNIVLVAGWDATNWRDLGWVAPTEQVKAAPDAASAIDDAWLYEDQSQTGRKAGNP